MSLGLTEIEYFADSLNGRVKQLLKERDSLRKELARKSDGTIERDKEFVRACLDNIINKNIYSGKIARLEHILLTR